MTIPGVGSTVTVQVPALQAYHPPALPGQSESTVQVTFEGEPTPRSKGLGVWRVLQVSPFSRCPPACASCETPEAVMPWHEPHATWVTTWRPEAGGVTPKATGSWASDAAQMPGVVLAPEAQT